MRSMIDRARMVSGKRAIAHLMVAAVIVAAVIAVLLVAAATGPRRPPSIFDGPVENVYGYLSSDDFNALSLEDRLVFINDLAQRFRGMSQSESAVLSAFFSGLTGAAREQLRDNVRLLAKDILIEGADGYSSIEDPARRAAFLDEWIVRWVRFGRQLEGRAADATKEEILARLRREVEEDLERRPIPLGADVAQQLVNLWESDVAGVASPAEQGKIFHFLPAIRRHLIEQAP